MPLKRIILYHLRPCLMLVLLISITRLTNAQVIKDSLPATGKDSLIIIKQLIKETFTKQLQQCTPYQKIEQSRLKQLLSDAAITDSLAKLVLLQAHQLTATAVSTGKSVVKDVLHVPAQVLRQQFSKLIQMANVKGIISEFTGVVKQPLLQFKGASITVQGQSAPSLFGDGTTFINSNIVSSSWAITGIPLGLQLMRQDFTGPEYYARNTFSFQFDREAYLNSLRDKIKLKVNGRDLLPDYNDALQRVKETAINRLRASLDSINHSYHGFLRKQLAQLGDPQSLLKGDMGALQDKLLSTDFLQDIESKKQQLAQMQQELDTGGNVNSEMYDSLLQCIQSVAGANKILSAIKSFKEEVQKSGLINKLQKAEQFKNNDLQQLLQDPDKLKSMAKDQLDLNGIQKLFLNMNQLKMGMNTVSLSPLTVYQYSNNGINAAFFNNKTYLFIMAGKQKEFSGLFDNHFASPVFSADNTAMGVRIGRGDISENHSHISLFTYKQSNSNYNGTEINKVPGTTVVVAFSNQLKLNATNYLNLEISKSAHKYSAEKNVYDTLQLVNSSSKQLLNGENFIQQMAFTLQWNGEVKDRQLSYDLHGTKIGKGYNNPGSFFISRGMTAFGGSVKKNFLQNQLQVSARVNYHEYEYSNSNNKYRNYNFSFLGKWKFKKGQYISLRYQPYQSLRWQDNIKYNIGSSNQLSLEGNLRKRFSKISYQHTISFSALRNNYQFGTIPVGNKSLLVSSLQTITINNKSYYLNTQYNWAKIPSALFLFNTQFSVDAGLMYNIHKGIVGSTALNYNSTKGWFRQAGIRQTISGQIGERFIVSVYADIIKNIKEYRPNNMGVSRLDWSLQYLLK